MILLKYLKCIFSLLLILNATIQAQTPPDQIKFVRQGVQRIVFDEDQSIPLAKLQPGNIIGLEAMHPITHYNEQQASVEIDEDKLLVRSAQETQTGIWFGGFNPFATYTVDLAAVSGKGSSSRHQRALLVDTRSSP